MYLETAEHHQGETESWQVLSCCWCLWFEKHLDSLKQRWVNTQQHSEISCLVSTFVCRKKLPNIINHQMYQCKMIQVLAFCWIWVAEHQTAVRYTMEALDSTAMLYINLHVFVHVQSNELPTRRTVSPHETAVHASFLLLCNPRPPCLDISVLGFVAIHVQHLLFKHTCRQLELSPIFLFIPVGLRCMSAQKGFVSMRTKYGGC